MSVKDDMDRLTKGVVNATPPRLGTLPMKTAPAPSQTAPGALATYSKEFRVLQEEVALLRERQGLPATLPLAQIHKSPYQTRKIDEFRVVELAENLRHNPQSTPITVRLIKPGHYEIIAGHHRLAAFTRLGRSEIAASVISLTDTEARRLVFYDNLMAPQISDYEKYAGFAAIKEQEGLTIEKLAMQSGVSDKLVGAIMTFGRLPAAVLEILDQSPTVLGAGMAAKLVALPSKYEARIVEAVRQVADGRLKQANALAWILEKQGPEKVEPTMIRSGRSKFAEIVQRSNQVTIKFADPDEAQAIQGELVELLKRRASSQK